MDEKQIFRNKKRVVVTTTRRGWDRGKLVFHNKNNNKKKVKSKPGESYYILYFNDMKSVSF